VWLERSGGHLAIADIVRVAGISAAARAGLANSGQSSWPGGSGRQAHGMMATVYVSYETARTLLLPHFRSSLTSLSLTSSCPRSAAMTLSTIVRDTPETELIPIIVLSGLNRHTDFQRAEDLGATAYLIRDDVKSFKPPVLSRWHITGGLNY